MTPRTNHIDYGTLYETGLRYAASLAHTTWTDFNPSDPGLTLLEQFCYALTDLHYRTGFRIADLLAPGAKEAYSALFTPREVLHIQPVHFRDFRKLLIDTPGVKNADLKETQLSTLYYAPFSKEILLEKDLDPQLFEDIYRKIFLRGLYRVQLEKIPFTDTVWVKKNAWEKLQGNRSLCSDYTGLDILPEQKIWIESVLEIEEGEPPEQLLARIWKVLSDHLAPTPSFRTLDDLRKRYLVEQIFNGPALEHGFLEDRDLEQFERRLELRRSDIIRLLMDFSPAIKTIRTLKIFPEGVEEDKCLEWLFKLEPEKIATFQPENSTFRFFRGELEIPYNRGETLTLFQEMMSRQYHQPSPRRQRNIFPTPGRDRQVHRYTSIRTHLPEMYGITEAGLPESASPQAHALARQLSAFLLFFEQTLAAFFRQLGSAWQLFSVVRHDEDEQSYFDQMLDEEIPQTQGVFNTQDAQKRLLHIRRQLQSIYGTEPARTNQFLDHLLARFAEQFLAEVLSPNAAGNTHSKPAAAKRSFLRSYPKLGVARGTGFNYTGEVWNTDNISGLKRRIAALLGLVETSRTGIDGDREDFFMVEHILLRPVAGDEFQEEALIAYLEDEDPWSLRISFVFPITGRFREESFRNFTEQLVRIETPAHIRVQICWLKTETQSEEPSPMEAFTMAYQKFLMALQQDSTNISTDNLSEEEVHQYALRVARDRLLDVLYQWSLIPKTGIPFPIRDLFIPEDGVVFAVQDEQAPEWWQAAIKIYYPQSNVIYRLCNRYREPVEDDNGEEITASGNDPSYENDRPYLELNTPRINRDTTYWIRAEKSICRTIDSPPEVMNLRYIFLKQSVRVRVGVAPIVVVAQPKEIDYQGTTTVKLQRAQANVKYKLFIGVQPLLKIDDDHDGTVSGPQGETISVEIPGDKIIDDFAFTEDCTIRVDGSMDDFNQDIETVGEVHIRVRANPKLKLSVSPEIIPAFIADQPAPLLKFDLIYDEENPVQDSVNYTLFRREINDREFVHHKAQQPPDEEVKIIEEEETGTVIAKVQRPQLPDPEAFGPDAPTPSGYFRIGSFTDDTLEISNKVPKMQLTEDNLFFVVASKPGHIKPVILKGEHPDLPYITAVLTKPLASPSFAIDPPVVPPGERGKVKIDYPQPGVKYYLRNKNSGQDQRFVYVHDTRSHPVPSPRRDGVGYSKIEVDTVVGPVVTRPIKVMTDQPLDGDREYSLIAEKIQTKLTIVLGDILFK